MKNSKKKFAYLIIAVCFAINTNMKSQTVCNGFYPEQNDLTVAVSYGSKKNSEFYRGTELGGNPAMLGDISSSMINLYAEYGITDWLSATATLPYITVKSDDGQPDPVLLSDQVEGLQDLGLYLKGKIYEAKINSGDSFKLGSAFGFSFPISLSLIHISEPTRPY